jgi:hypothetical protein
MDHEEQDIGDESADRKTEQGFTPPPWEVIPDTYNYGTIRITAPDPRFADGLPIAFVPSRMAVGEPEYGNGYYEKREDAAANARLIAAAPALYAACQAMRKSLNGSATDFAGMLAAHRQLDAAVALVNKPDKNSANSDHPAHGQASETNDQI